MLKNVVIVIPIHSSEPSIYELLSFKRCFEILHKYDIVVLIPNGLYLGRYVEIIKEFVFLEIDPRYFSNISMYNELKISEYFYNLFSNYNYLLTYELDSYVFSDELNFWCTKKIDYIGAPWMENWTDNNSTKIIGVGNSGFSLRNISKCNSILFRLRIIKFLFSVWIRFCPLKNIISFYRILKFFKRIFRIKDPNHVLNLLNKKSKNEDGFWAIDVYRGFNDFNVANYVDAISFSFEVNPAYLFSINNYVLPFGCHAYLKYDFNFWKNFIYELNK